MAWGGGRGGVISRVYVRRVTKFIYLGSDLLGAQQEKSKFDLIPLFFVRLLALVRRFSSEVKVTSVLLMNHVYMCLCT